MAWYRIAENILDAIADAINAKTGRTAPMTPVDMVSEIQSIQTGSGAPVLLVDQTATEAVEIINVPFPAAAEDYAIFLFILTGTVSAGDWVYPAFNANTPGSEHEYFNAGEYHKFSNGLDNSLNFALSLATRGSIIANYPIQNAVFGAYSGGAFSVGFNIKIYGLVRWDEIENYV